MILVCSIQAGRPQRIDGQAPRSGELYLSFEDNVFEDDADAQTPPQGASLITFTNARATELPCELNPPTTPPCSGRTGPLAFIWWTYLEGATFDLHHTGELDVVRIDHPQFDPIDGTELGNTLRINDEVVPYQTFVVVP